MTDTKVILYIEDDDASRLLIQRILSSSGYEVYTASRGLEGIDLAKQIRPDLILTDINLPDLSGREITIRLRSDPRLQSVPIVALTAQTQAFERDKTLVAGVNGYLTKPVNVAELNEKIAMYMDGGTDDIDVETLATARDAYRAELVERLEKSVRELEANNRELRRLDGIKDDFIQLTAHELRTPLTTVYGYSRLVQSSDLIRELMAQDPDVKATLSGLIDSIERLHTVISEVITVSRIALDRVDLKLSPAHLGEVIKRVVDEYGAVTRQRGLHVKVKPSEWPAPVVVDVALLELAFSNLLGNAIKYTPDNGTITIRAQSGGGMVRISFSDTGIGIDPKDQQHIFNRFYTAGDTQLHSTSKTAFRGGGLGLGLAIARGIVEAHSGRIWVESEGADEKRMPGSTFFIELPLRRHMPGAVHEAFL